VTAATRVGRPVARRVKAAEIGRSPRADRELIEAVDRALEVLHGKWKVHLLFVMARGIHRHSRLLECLPGVSKKVMTESLRALERDGVVTRKIYAEVPVRVEYSLTPLGWTMTEPLIALADWGASHGGEVAAARSHRRFAEDADGHKGSSSSKRLVAA
jgi:DNA-binding HxlR family transcriptional regulator